LDELGGRTTRALLSQLTLRRERLDARQRALTSADPRAILGRGYAIVEAGGQRLTAARQTATGADVDIHLAQGRLRATVHEIED
jgi:exonuclease VII large subunit